MDEKIKEEITTNIRYSRRKKYIMKRAWRARYVPRFPVGADMHGGDIKAGNKSGRRNSKGMMKNGQYRFIPRKRNRFRRK